MNFKGSIIQLRIIKKFTESFSQHLLNLIIIFITFFLISHKIFINGAQYFFLNCDIAGYYIGLSYVYEQLFKFHKIIIWHPYQHCGWPLEPISFSITYIIPILLSGGNLHIAMVIASSLPYLLSGIFMYVYTYYISRKKNQALIASIFYMTDQYISVEGTFYSGHIDIAWNYAFMPIILITLECLKFFKNHSIILLSTFTVIIFLSSHNNMVVIYSIVMLYYIFTLWIEQPKNLAFLKNVLIFIISCSLGFLPKIVYLLVTQNSFKEVSFTRKDILFFTEFQYVNAFLGLVHHPPFSPEFSSLIPLIIVLLSMSVLLLKRSFRIISFSSLFLLSVFLVNGYRLNRISEAIYFWIYENLPFFRTLRTVMRFMTITSFTRSYLISEFCEFLFLKIGSNLSRKINRKILLNIFTMLFITMFSILAVFNSINLYIRGPLVRDIPSEVKIIHSYLECIYDKNYRIAGIPLNSTWIMLDGYSIVRPYIFHNIIEDRRIVWGYGEITCPKDTRQIITEINNLIYLGDDYGVSTLLGLLSAKYIVIYPEANIVEKDLFLRSKNFEKIFNDSQAIILKNRNVLPRLFISKGLALIIGETTDLPSIVRIFKKFGINLQDVVLTFWSQQKDNFKQFDLVLCSLKFKDVTISQILNNLEYYKFIVLFSEGEDLPQISKINGEYNVINSFGASSGKMLRVRGKINLSLNIPSINEYSIAILYRNENSDEWLSIKNVIFNSINGNIILEFDDYTYIDLIIFFPKNFENLYALDNVNIIDWVSSNPEEYKITLNVTKHSILTFTESYDPLWEMSINGKKLDSIETYGCYNSFFISAEGLIEADLQYKGSFIIILSFLPYLFIILLITVKQILRH